MEEATQCAGGDHCADAKVKMEELIRTCVQALSSRYG